MLHAKRTPAVNVDDREQRPVHAAIGVTRPPSAIRYGGSWGSGKPCPFCHQRPTGRHTQGKGFSDDLEKRNEAITRGWRVVHVTPEMVQDGRAMNWLLQLLASEPLE